MPTLRTLSRPLAQATQLLASRRCLPQTTRRGYAALRVNQARLMEDLHSTCRFGTGLRWGEHETETGMARLALSDSDKLAREWFADTVRSLGCALTVDEMGNMFAVRPGRHAGAATFAGSHLDTQPTGGRYDGILGVTAGVEMLRVLDEARYETQFPVGVVNWTNEEGARFPMSMVASGVWAGAVPLATAHALASVVRGEEHQTMRSELARIGFLGSVPCSWEAMPMAAHFELHIEQGPLLERHAQRIGVVQGVQAYRWFTLTVHGRDAHTGSTDLAGRADALLAASKMIVASRVAAHAEGGLASTGIIEALPGSTNTIPGSVRFSLDIRAQADEVVQRIEDRLRRDFDGIAAGRDPAWMANDAPTDTVQVAWRQDQDSPAAPFDAACIACVEDAAGALFGARAPVLTRRMVSGAGHDSVYAGRRVPASMIFVPCRDGVSHNPREYTSPEDCTVGAQVLMGAVLRFDERRALG